MSNPAKKLKIRPPLRPSYKDHATSLNLICNAIDMIYAKKASNLSFEEIYRSAYYLVLDSSGSTLYQAVLDSFVKLLKEEVQKLAQFIPTDNYSGESGSGFLRLVLNCWEHFRVCLKMTSDVLMYMDKMYCQSNSKPLVQDAGLQLFRNEFVRSAIAPIRVSIQNCLIKQIEHERNGNIIDAVLMKEIIDMLLNLGDSLADLIDARPPSTVHGERLESGSVYEVDFETRFLENTNAYYTLEAESKSQLSVPEYLRLCEQRLTEESERVARYLSRNTLNPLILIVETSLLKLPLPRLIETGLVPMLQDLKFDDLHRFYRLCKRLPDGLSVLREAIATYFRSHSPKLLELLLSSQQSANETQSFLDWAEQALQLHANIQSLCTSSFHSDPSFEKAMQTALADVVNKNSILAAEAVSACLDHCLRKGMKQSDMDVEPHLLRYLKVFSYLQDKDAFATYFHQSQSKRLLTKPSANEDHENIVIHQLRTMCGSQFTCKFEKKLVDMATSLDLSLQFKQTFAPSFDVHVDVLTSSLWPSSFAASQSASMCIIPSPLKDVIASFEKFYSSVHSNRLLTWQPQWGSGEIRGYFKQVNDLTINTFGIIILLQFNIKDSFTMEELLINTHLPEDELTRYLLSLSLGKFKILVKRPATKEVQRSDTFDFNANFKEKRVKLKVPLISVTKTEKLTDASTLVQLENERGTAIDAVLVRVMKSRKRMHHSELMTEVIKQLTHHFQPQPPLIKKRIENLIERDFLERDPKDASVYIYVA